MSLETNIFERVGIHVTPAQLEELIHEAYPEADGLDYASVMNALEPALVLYERAEAALGQVPIFHRALADPTVRLVLEQAASVLNYPLGL